MVGLKVGGLRMVAMGMLLLVGLLVGRKVGVGLGRLVGCSVSVAVGYGVGYGVSGDFVGSNESGEFVLVSLNMLEHSGRR